MLTQVPTAAPKLELKLNIQVGVSACICLFLPAAHYCMPCVMEIAKLGAGCSGRPLFNAVRDAAGWGPAPSTPLPAREFPARGLPIDGSRQKPPTTEEPQRCRRGRGVPPSFPVNADGTGAGASHVCCFQCTRPAIAVAVMQRKAVALCPDRNFSRLRPHAAHSASITIAAAASCALNFTRRHPPHTCICRPLRAATRPTSAEEGSRKAVQTSPTRDSRTINGMLADRYRSTLRPVRPGAARTHTRNHTRTHTRSAGVSCWLGAGRPATRARYHTSSMTRPRACNRRRVTGRLRRHTPNVAGVSVRRVRARGLPAGGRRCRAPSICRRAG